MELLGVLTRDIDDWLILVAVALTIAQSVFTGFGNLSPPPSLAQLTNPHQFFTLGTGASTMPTYL